MVAVAAGARQIPGAERASRYVEPVKIQLLRRPPVPFSLRESIERKALDAAKDPGSGMIRCLRVCPDCGRETTPEDRFCPHCGNGLNVSDSAAAGSRRPR